MNDRSIIRITADRCEGEIQKPGDLPAKLFEFIRGGNLRDLLFSDMPLQPVNKFAQGGTVPQVSLPAAGEFHLVFYRLEKFCGRFFQDQLAFP